MLHDAAVFPRFKADFAAACPKTTAQAMSVAKRIVKKLSDGKVGAKWVEHLDTMYGEIVEKKGAASHHMEH